MRWRQSTAVKSVGYTLTQGGTTLGEQWNPQALQGVITDGAPDGANSYNHPSRTPIAGWFMRTVAGIDSGSPGYANVTMRPRPDSSVTWANGYFDGPRGRIESAWGITSKGMAWHVVIPPNSTGTLTIPPGYGTVKVSGTAISTVGTSSSADPITGGARWIMPSGTYELLLTA